MTSPQTLNLLRTQAEQADKIIAELTSQISVLKEAAVSYVGKDEAARLQKENDILRKEVEQAKIQLVMAEIHNGVRQVFVPNRSVSTSAPDSTMKTETVEEKKKDDKPKKEKKQAPKEKNPAAAKPDNKAEETIDISRLDMRIGKILSVKKHPDADTLYVEEVDIGEEKNRTVVSGLVKSVPLEQMQDRLAVFMCNLKPAKMRGVLSEGMIMCASTTPDKVEILIPPAGVKPGDRISFEGYPGEPDALLNPKKKIWETLKPFVKTDANKVATYKGVPFKVEGKGIVVAETLPNAQIS
ncbi:aminoacyl tRNA synthase complex-interacting multifunctional protein 1-like isoform X2 [Gigantopelta aegis]|nr:aminoacyl tRNA synthase complex-interacting multifunctional protein 1-like isoform X2 [Gigantopelta aegis]